MSGGSQRPKLRRAVKRDWLKALRSGDFTQGRAALRTAIPGNTFSPGHDELCCLGVRCELAVKAGVIPAPFTDEPSPLFRYPDPSTEPGVSFTDVPPRAERRWAWRNYDRDKEEIGVAESVLIGMNDGGATFAVIADYIEENF